MRHRSGNNTLSAIASYVHATLHVCLQLYNCVNEIYKFMCIGSRDVSIPITYTYIVYYVLWYVLYVITTPPRTISFDV